MAAEGGAVAAGAVAADGGLHAQREGGDFADVAKGEASEHGDAADAAQGADHTGEVVAAVVYVACAAHAEVAEHDGLLALEDAGQMQGLQHALEAVGLFAHVFEEEDAAFGLRQVGRAGQGGNHAEVAAPHGAVQGGHVGGLHFRYLNAQIGAGAAVDKGLHGVHRGLGLAEGAIKHGAGEAAHIALGEQGELDGAHVAEAEKLGAVFAHACAERGPVDMGQQAHCAVAAAHAHQHLWGGHFAGSHVLEIGDAFGVGTGKPLAAALHGLLVGDGETGVIQAQQPGLRLFRLGREAGRGHHAQGGAAAAADGAGRRIAAACAALVGRQHGHGGRTTCLQHACPGQGGGGAEKTAAGKMGEQHDGFP